MKVLTIISLLLFISCSDKVESERKLATVDTLPSIFLNKSHDNELIEVIDSININDSISYKIYKKEDGICEKLILITEKNNKEYKGIELSKHCNQDLSAVQYNWKEFKELSKNEFKIISYTETVVDSLITEDELIKGGKSFDEVRTLTDSSTVVIYLNSTGEIIEKK